MSEVCRQGGKAEQSGSQGKIRVGCRKPLCCLEMNWGCSLLCCPAAEVWLCWVSPAQCCEAAGPSQLPLHGSLCTALPAQLPLHSSSCTAPSAQLPLHSSLCTAPSAQFPLHSSPCTAPPAQIPLQSSHCRALTAELPLHSCLCTALPAQLPLYRGCPSTDRRILSASLGCPNSSWPFWQGDLKAPSCSLLGANGVPFRFVQIKFISLSLNPQAVRERQAGWDISLEPVPLIFTRTHTNVYFLTSVVERAICCPCCMAVLGQHVSFWSKWACVC